METEIIEQASKSAKIIGEAINNSYNQAIDHAVKIVQQHGIGNSTLQPVLDSITRSLQTLKS